MRVAASLQLFFLRAQHHNELIGDTLEVDVSLSMPKGDAKDILANVDCRLAGDKSADQGKQRALEEYYAAVQAYWSRRSEEHTSELQSLKRISYAVFCLNTKKTNTHTNQ